MKNNNMFEEFENLLLHKDFEQLDEDEKTLAHLFCDGSHEYTAMRQVMHQSQSLAEECGATIPPVGGAGQVWQRFVAQKKIKGRTMIFRRKISVMWAAGLAAALIFTWLIRFPDYKEKADSALIKVDSPQLISATKTDTVIKEIPVYIQIEAATDLN